MSKKRSIFEALTWGIIFGLLSFMVCTNLIFSDVSNLKLNSRVDQDIEFAKNRMNSLSGKIELVNAYYTKYEETQEEKYLEQAGKILESVNSDEVPVKDYFLGIIYLNQKKENLALKHLEMFLKSEPLNQEAQFARGIALINTKQYENALNALKNFDTVKPGLADTYMLMAKAYQGLKQVKQANEAQSKANMLLGKLK